jgi:hypothetical protein
MNRALNLLCAAALFIPAREARADISYTFTTIQYPGATYTSLNRINDSGEILVEAQGGSVNANGATFLYQNGTLTNLNLSVSAGNFEMAQGIDNAGQVLGNTISYNGNQNWIYQNGTFTNLNLPGVAGAISSNGLIIAGGYGNGLQNWLYLAEGGNISTVFQQPSNWQSGGVSGVNDTGQAVGTYISNVAGGREYGFLYSGGALTTLSGPSGAIDAIAAGINNAGQIVGDSDLGGNQHVEWIYSNGAYSIISFPNSWPLPSVSDINNIGQIVGSYATQYQDGPENILPSIGFLGTPILTVPEPSSLVIALGAIIIGAGFWKLRSHECAHSARDGFLSGQAKLVESQRRPS